MFDRFEDEVCLGGTATNFAWYCAQFGLSVSLVSAVGHDELGRTALNLLGQAGIDLRGVQIKSKPTGTVDVVLKDGQPTYVIHENVAWDFVTPPLRASQTPACLLYYGTLGQRHPVSRAALQELFTLNVEHRFFDLNLRQDFFSPTIILDGLQQADWVKLNDEEWDLIQPICGVDAPADLLPLFDLQAVALTRGRDGAALYTSGREDIQAGFEVEVEDAVGAGDAFSAALATGLLRGGDPKGVLESACRVGAAVVSRRGAQTVLDRDLREGVARPRRRA